MQQPPPTTVHGVVPRTLAILRVLATADGDRHSASALARTTGIPLQTVHRILNDLADGGLALRDATSREWSLGPMALTLGAAAQRHVTWIGLARTAMDKITAATQETTILTLREDAYASHTHIVESPQRLRLTEHVGLRLPLTVGASRRAILAHLPTAQQASVLATLTEDGIAIDQAALDAQCHDIRARGYAVSNSEVSDHTLGVAVPILHQGQPLGSLLVAGPEHRMATSAIIDAATLLHEQTAWIRTTWGDAPRDHEQSVPEVIPPTR